MAHVQLERARNQTGLWWDGKRQALSLRGRACALQLTALLLLCERHYTAGVAAAAAGVRLGRGGMLQPEAVSDALQHEAVVARHAREVQRRDARVAHELHQQGLNQRSGGGGGWGVGAGRPSFPNSRPSTVAVPARADRLCAPQLPLCAPQWRRSDGGGSNETCCSIASEFMAAANWRGGMSRGCCLAARRGPRNAECRRARSGFPWPTAALGPPARCDDDEVRS